MTLMTVKDDGDEDFRNKPRWSANKKMDAVMRLLRGETIDQVSRDIGIEAHRLAAWRDDFVAGGRRADGDVSDGAGEGLGGGEGGKEEDSEGQQDRAARSSVG